MDKDEQIQQLRDEVYQLKLLVKGIQDEEIERQRHARWELKNRLTVGVFVFVFVVCFVVIYPRSPLRHIHEGIAMILSAVMAAMWAAGVLWVIFLVRWIKTGYLP